MQKVLDSAKREEKTHLVCIALVFLLGVGIRLYFLFDLMRYDETYTFVHFVSKPLHIGLTDYHSSNNHPFHTLLVHAAYLLLGNKPWVVRLPALLAGILTIPASYAVIRIFYNRDAALLTASLAAVSSKLVEYSVNARGYSLVCLIFLLTLALAAYLKHSRSMRAWLLFAALSALGAYTIPVMLLPFGVVTIWLLLSITLENEGALRKELLTRLSMAAAATALLTLALYLPIFIVSGPASVFAHQFLRPLSWSEFALQFWTFLQSVWRDWHRDVPAGIEYALASAAIVSAVFHARLSRFRVPVAPVAIGWPIAVALAQRALLTHGDRSRLWFFMLPLYLGLASAGLSYLTQVLPRRMYRSAAVALLSIALPVWLGSRVLNSKSVSHEWGTVKDAPKVAAFLKDYLRPTDAVMALHRSASIFEYYLSVQGIDKTFNEFPSETNRIICIADETKHRRVEDILENSGASLAGNLRNVFPDFSEPRLLKRYDSASVYELYRLRLPKEK